MLHRSIAAVLLLLVLASCAQQREGEQARSQRRADGKDSKKVAPAKAAKKSPPRLVDPRKGGLEIGLGEWALTPEASVIRPGRVTFVIRNRGTIPHGFEIELEGDSSGHGSGDLFKAESRLLQPGESTRLTVSLTAAVYKIECLVDGHDDMGMEGLLEVRADAPKKQVRPKSAPGSVAIADFAFDPSVTEISTGTEVTWHNDDPTQHTVTALGETFDSDTLESGDSFSFRFENPGVYDYRCAIHPDMKGSVNVE